MEGKIAIWLEVAQNPQPSTIGSDEYILMNTESTDMVEANKDKTYVLMAMISAPCRDGCWSQWLIDIYKVQS